MAGNGCSSCGGGSALGGSGARAVEKWIYQGPDGKRTEYSSKAEADIQVTRNGGGIVYRKP